MQVIYKTGSRTRKHFFMNIYTTTYKYWKGNTKKRCWKTYTTILLSKEDLKTLYQFQFQASIIFGPRYSTPRNKSFGTSISSNQQLWLSSFTSLPSAERQVMLELLSRMHAKKTMQACMNHNWIENDKF